MPASIKAFMNLSPHFIHRNNALQHPSFRVVFYQQTSDLNLWLKRNRFYPPVRLWRD
jgi:hypothetical protein